MARVRSVRKSASVAQTTQKVVAFATSWFNNTFRGQSRDFNNLLGITFLLVVFGLVMVLSASYVKSLGDGDGPLAVFSRQFAWALIGFVALGVMSRLPVAFIQKVAPFFFLAMLLMQLLVLVIGTEIYGNRNWIRIGDFSFQPSEFLKLGLLLVISAMLVSRRDYLDSLRYGWFAPLMAAGGSTALVLLGADLGTAIVMFGFSLVMLILAGMPSKIAIWVFIGASVAALAFSSFGSRRVRIAAWLNPDAVDVTGATWQARHGIWALAAGGIGGTGLGDSKMKWNWIPMVDNDYIFSVVGEEWGLVGASILIILFVLLAMSLIRILNRTDRLYERYVLLGIMSWITIQAFVNIGVVLNFLPVLGVPLPLISAGGTSLLITMTTLGIALGIERRNSTARPVATARSANRVRVVR